MSDNIMISLSSDLAKEAKTKLKGRVSSICAEALKKELNFIENQPSEEQLLQELLEVKQEVQKMGYLEGGATAIKSVASEIIHKKGRNPQTFEEKLCFWKEIKEKARHILMRQKVSPTTPSKKGDLQ